MFHLLFPVISPLHSGWDDKSYSSIIFQRIQEDTGFFKNLLNFLRKEHPGHGSKVLFFLLDGRNFHFRVKKCRCHIIFALNDAILQVNFVDFYTNIHYTIFSTFKEGRLCIEKSPVFWKPGKIANTASLLFYRAQDRWEKPILFWNSDVPIMKMWRISILKPIQS